MWVRLGRPHFDAQVLEPGPHTLKIAVADITDGLVDTAAFVTGSVTLVEEEPAKTVSDPHVQGLLCPSARMCKEGREHQKKKITTKYKRIYELIDAHPFFVFLSLKKKQ